MEIVSKYKLDKEQSFDRVIGHIEEAGDFHAEKNTIGNRNYAFYKGIQWTRNELLAHEKQFRYAYVFNEIQNKIDHMIGTQTQTRLDSKSVPREKGDEAVAELITNLIKWSEQTNNLEYTETDVFTSQLIRGAGASVIKWKKEDIQYGYPCIEKVPITELLWDRNSKNIDLSDCRWMARIQYITKMDAMEMYPQYSNDIENASLRDITLTGYDCYTRWNNSRYGTDYQELKSSRLEDEGLIPLIEHYEKVKVYKYIVADGIQNKTYEFDSKKQAKSFYEGMKSEYASQGQILINSDGESAIAMDRIIKSQVVQTICIGHISVYHNWTALDSLPYDIAFCFFDNGDYWSYVDILIDPQILVNRYFSQWDYILGSSSKNALTVMESLLKKGFTIEDLRREISKTVTVIPVNQHGAINPLPNQQVNPELFQGIQYAIGRMNDYVGGRNVMGLQENAAESGRAVNARTEQAGISRLPLFDRLRLWRQSLTYKIVWYIKNFMPIGQVVRVVGLENELNYYKIEEELLDTIREIKIDIIVDEANKSDTVNERYFTIIKELAAQTQFPPEILSPMMIEFSNLPQTKKDKLLSMFEFYKEYQQKQMAMQEEQKMQKEVDSSIKKKKMRDQLKMDDDLLQQEQEVELKRKNIKEKLEELDAMQKEYDVRKMQMPSLQSGGDKKDLNNVSIYNAQL